MIGTSTPILSAVLPIASAALMEQSTRAARPPTVADACASAPPRLRMPVRSSSAWRPSPFSPPDARSPARLDAFEALLAALADRDQLGLDLPTALDRQADGVGGGASGHNSGISRWLRARRRRTAGSLPEPRCGVRYQALCGPGVEPGPIERAKP